MDEITNGFITPNAKTQRGKLAPPDMNRKIARGFHTCHTFQEPLLQLARSLYNAA